MSIVSPPAAQEVETLATLLERLGNIPLDRIRIHPPPGTATEEDVLRAGNGRIRRLCELVDGVLVEKMMGYHESLVACLLIHAILDFVRPQRLGIVLAPDGALRILPDQVRIPDVSFISWDRFPDRRLPQEPIPHVAPDLAVEVLSQGNTEAEMQRKLRDYFEAGTRLIWYVQPATRSVRVYTSPDQEVLLRFDDTLTGGDVLPGFELPLRDLFAEIDDRTVH